MWAREVDTPEPLPVYGGRMSVSGMAGEEVHKTVEDLNPRSKPVMVLKKTAERAILMRELCTAVYEEVGYPEMIFTHPASLDSKYRTKLREIWGQRWWLHPESRAWPEIVAMWRSGSLDRQINDMAANLPSAIRKKVLG